ncbi:hypothetical protein [Flindersiella endophytica]
MLSENGGAKSALGIHRRDEGPRSFTRRRAVQLGLLLPAAGLAGMAGTAGCAPQPPPLIEGAADADDGVPDVDDLQALLDRRAKAQLAKDENAYLANLDTQNQAMLDREKLVFANLEQFALADVRFLTGRILAGGQADEKDPNRFRFGPVIKVVKLTADAGPKAVLGPGEAYDYVLTKQGDGWQIADIVPITGDAAANARVGTASSPWNLTPLTVLTAGNIWLAADDSVDDLERYAKAAKSEARTVEAMWGKRAHFPGHVLFFSRNKENLTKWYDLGDASDHFEGVQKPLFGVTKDGDQYTSQTYASRMVIFLSAIEQYSDDPALVMRHELTHAVTSRAADPGDGIYPPPRWAVEGFARYIEVRGNAERQRNERFAAANGLRTGRLKDKLPRSDKFYSGSADNVSFNYAIGYTVFAYVAQAKGHEKAVAFYAEIVKFTEPFGQQLVETPAFDGICDRILGMSSATLLRQWRSYVLAGG